MRVWDICSGGGACFDPTEKKMDLATADETHK